MKTGIACLLLVIVAVQGRGLAGYGGYSGKSSHPPASDPHKCRSEVGFKVEKKYGSCGNAYCGSGQYCKTTKETNCQYYALDKCPKYGFITAKCDPIVIQCGKKTCGFGYKCAEKKVCGTDYQEYNDGHRTTVETKKCWYEKVCEKEEPPKVCETKPYYACYEGHEPLGTYKGYQYQDVYGDPNCKCGHHKCKVAYVKECKIDPKYLAIAQGVKCGDKKCPPGHKCTGSCKVCKYEEVAYPACEHVSYYKPVPCGSHVCKHDEKCVVDTRKVCDKGDGHGYSYSTKGEHVSKKEGGYEYVPDSHYKSGYYYYYSEESYYYEYGFGSGSGSGHKSGGSGSGHKSSGGGSGHHSGGGSGHKSGGGSGHPGSSGHPGGSGRPGSKGPGDKPSSTSPTPPPSPPPTPPPVAAARSASASTEDATATDAQIAVQGNAASASTAASDAPGSASQSAVAFAGGDFASISAAVADGADKTAQSTVAAIVAP